MSNEKAHRVVKKYGKKQESFMVSEMMLIYSSLYSALSLKCIEINPSLPVLP